MSLRRVVITGLGALTPIGNTVPEYWEALEAGKSGAAPITKFDAANFKTRFACEVKNYDPLSHMDRKEARKADPFSQYALYVSEQALKDSGLEEGTFNPDRAGVIWGSGIGGIKTFQDEVSDFVISGKGPRFNPFFIPKMIADMAAGLISIRYNLRGINYVTVSACASATNAIMSAYNYIRLGKADILVSGGSESAVTEAGMGGFNAMKALSESNDSPETASRPFDKDRNGFVLGEGAGALILEDLEHAKARGAKIYAEIVGAGASADAYHMTAPHPEGVGAQMVMRNALTDKGINPEEVDYINVHGTSTPLGDISEANAVREVFGEHAYSLNISSTKSMTGHLLGASGAIEAIAGIMAIQKQIVPPTINHFTDDEAFDPKMNFTFNKAQKRKVDVVLSNTFGFGGHNFSLILRRYQA